MKKETEGTGSPRFFYKNFLQLLFGVVVYLVAELAGELRFALVPDELGQILFAHADQRPGHPVAGAVAAVLHRVLLQNLQVEIL